MKGRNFGLDLVRVLAILPVLTIHFAANAFGDIPLLLYAAGDMGVEIFYALSGFLIGGIILRDFANGFSWGIVGNFYVRRWMRTLPLYYLFGLVNLVVTAYGFLADPAVSWRLLAYIPFLQNLAWPIVAPWYQESWSLAVEEWFYLLFPLIFALIPGRPRLRIFMIALVLGSVPLILRIVAAEHALPYDLISRAVVYRLDAIAYGIMAVWIVTAWPEQSAYWKNVAGFLGGLGVIITALIVIGHIDIGGFALLTFGFSLPSASFAAIVVWASLRDWPSWEAGGESKIVRWISTRSYSLYLCHGTVVRYMVHGGVFHRPHMESLSFFMVASCLLAEGLYRFIERPFMAMRRHVSRE
ncbi:acyltransferase family protein [Gluconacetobacter sacchari]|uniref:acyltransferase family protein n=1 Tax=Gluconacetobacter sacchari TaxID=92759 RepID=UPI0039B3B6F3